MNYFKENIHFCNFFSSRIFLVSRRFFFLKLKKKSTDSVGKGFDIAQHDAVVALKKKKKQKYLWTLFFRGLYISLQPTYIRYMIHCNSIGSTAAVLSRQGLGFLSSNNLDT